MYDTILVRYGEIGLKGQNRSYFEAKLVENIKRALGGYPVSRVYKTHGRVLVEPEGPWEEVANRLTDVFGIVVINPAVRIPPQLEGILEASVRVVKDASGGEPTTFKVETRRADKSFPKKSPELNRLVGAACLKSVPGLKVDVHHPQVRLNVEIREDGAYVYCHALKGPGGLPVGTSGKGLLLLSGGIDSPVAGWMAMKRGIQVEAIHFHSFPLTSDRSKEKVIDLSRELAWYGGPFRLHVVHFTEVQKAIQKECPEGLRVTIMRRMMFRIAESLAQRRKILALVTGESVGQVASQTLESLAVINRVTRMPVIRPLVGFDKGEITDLAKRIGTYEISIRPYEDCCTLFVPRHPKTRPREEQAEEAEANLEVDSLVDEALQKTETLVLEPRRHW